MLVFSVKDKETKVRDTKKAEGEKDNIRSRLEQMVDGQHGVLAVVDDLCHEPSSPISPVSGPKST